MMTYPVFHPPCCLTNTHLPHSHPFFDFNTCVIGDHISLYIVMSKAVYSLIAIVMKTQTLPFASFRADLLNGMCPLGNISYFLLAFLLRFVSPRCIDLSFPYRFPFRHVFQDAIHPPSSHGYTNIPCYYISTGRSLHLDQRASNILLVIISYLPSPPQLCQCVGLKALVV